MKRIVTMHSNVYFSPSKPPLVSGKRIEWYWSDSMPCPNHSQPARVALYLLFREKEIFASFVVVQRRKQRRRVNLRRARLNQHQNELSWVGKWRIMSVELAILSLLTMASSSASSASFPSLGIVDEEWWLGMSVCGTNQQRIVGPFSQLTGETQYVQRYVVCVIELVNYDVTTM